MSYRSLHQANERFELTVMFVLLAAFFVALGLMFVHPSGSLAVFFLGLVIAAVAAFIEHRVKKAERKAARVELKRRNCPSCGKSIGQGEDGAWHCTACGANFAENGEQEVATPATML